MRRPNLRAVDGVRGNVFRRGVRTGGQVRDLRQGAELRQVDRGRDRASSTLISDHSPIAIDRLLPRQLRYPLDARSASAAPSQTICDLDEELKITDYCVFTVQSILPTVRRQHVFYNGSN